MILLSLLLAVGACDRTTPIKAASKTTETSGQSAASASAYSQFPDIPIPSGANINVEKTLIFGSKPWYGQLSLSTSTRADVMFDFYRNNLEQYDWHELTSVRAPTSILTYDSENRILAISIQASTLRGSEITLTVSPKGSPAPASRPGQAPVQPLQQIQ
ncbi:MAG: hypothetical protein HQ483_11690 [Rhodospirillales bacterium]|nr:hypothetical protein [Rhodospirillales bacterium]